MNYCNGDKNTASTFCNLCPYEGNCENCRMKAFFKRLDTSGHFPDFKHTAKGQRDNKKIRSRKERRILKKRQEGRNKYDNKDSNGSSV